MRPPQRTHYQGNPEQELDQIADSAHLPHQEGITHTRALEERAPDQSDLDQRLDDKKMPATERISGSILSN